MNQDITIRLTDMRFHARHGVGAQEREVGNEFSVDVTLRFPCPAVQTDALTDTIDYGRVAETVREVMEEPSQLLEHVCGRIQKAIMEEFPQISSGRVKVTKLSVPVRGIQMAGASATLKW